MQTKRSAQSRGPNKAELDFMAWCKEQPSVVSGQWGVHVHHCAGSTCKVRVGFELVQIGHWFCVPLTPDEHWMFHNRKKEFEKLYGYQRELWLRLVADYHESIPDNIFAGVAKSGR